MSVQANNEVCCLHVAAIGENMPERAISRQSHFRDCTNAIFFNYDLVMQDPYLKTLDDPLGKLTTIMMSPRKMKAFKDTHVPIRSSILSLIKFIFPIKMEVKKIKPEMSVPCVIKQNTLAQKVLDAEAFHFSRKGRDGGAFTTARKNYEYTRAVEAFRASGFSPFGTLQELLSKSNRRSLEFQFTYEEARLYIQNKVDTLTSRQESEWIADLTAECIEPNPGPRRTAQQKQRKRKNKNNNRRRRAAPNDNVIQMNSIMPAKKISILKYLDGSTVRNNPGGNFLVYSMRINDLYDPDPAILSGSVSNFKEMMQFYSYYRVLNTWIQWTVINLEAFPLSCGIVFSQTNLTGTIATLADAQNAFENDFVVPLRTIAAKGGIDRTEFRLNKLNMATLLGVGTQYRSESNYAGLGLATPTSPLWANFIVLSPTGAVMANGYANNTTLKMRSEFFGRLNVRA